MNTSAGSRPGTISGSVLLLFRKARRYSTYDMSNGASSCSYMEWSTQAASGSAGGMNPVSPSSSASSRSQSVSADAASGQRAAAGAAAVSYIGSG
ncbi:hypothetical protein ACWCYZ_06510 [Streptomyces virginiae]